MPEFFHLDFIKAVEKPNIFNAFFGCPTALGLKLFAITLHTLSSVLPWELHGCANLKLTRKAG
jgi:hypothetical protein